MVEDIHDRTETFLQLVEGVSVVFPSYVNDFSHPHDVQDVKKMTPVATCDQGKLTTLADPLQPYTWQELRDYPTWNESCTIYDPCKEGVQGMVGETLSNREETPSTK